MEYRIKQTIFRNKSEYVPQRKFLFFWIDLEEKLQPFDNIHDAKKYIEYYDLVKNKKNIVYHPVEGVNEDKK